MVKFFRKLAVLLAFSCLFPLPARAAEDPFDQASHAYWSLEENLRSGRNAAEWRKTGEAFSSAAKVKKPDEALHMAGICFERAHRLTAEDSDVKKALAFHARVFTEYRDSPFADDSLYRSAKLYENIGELDKSREFFRKVIDHYPLGDMAELSKVSIGRVGKAVELNAVRHWSGPSYTRIVFELSGLTPFEVKSLPSAEAGGKSHRVFVDLKRTAISKSCGEGHEVQDGLVSKIRVSQFSKDVVRVVMDLGDKAEYRVFPLLEPPRLVVDVLREEAEPEEDFVSVLIKKAEEKAGRPAGEGGGAPGARLRVEQPTPIRTSKFDALKRPGRKLRIVLDAGHGGKDPGAIGVGGLKEKDVTLAIVLEIKRLLEERGDVEIKLTRSIDEEVPLHRRTAIANAYQADLFLSVHANASRSKKARGMETFYLDKASDKAARKVAAAENLSSETGVIETEQILADVLLNMKLPESKRLAETVQREMLDRVVEAFGPVRDLGVRRAPFHVLTGAVMPAVLLETAFISNAVDAGWLRDVKFRSAIAQAVVAAIAAYSSGI